MLELHLGFGMTRIFTSEKRLLAWLRKYVRSDSLSKVKDSSPNYDFCYLGSTGRIHGRVRRMKVDPSEIE